MRQRHLNLFFRGHRGKPEFFTSTRATGARPFITTHFLPNSLPPNTFPKFLYIESHMHQTEANFPFLIAASRVRHRRKNQRCRKPRSSLPSDLPPTQNKMQRPDLGQRGPPLRPGGRVPLWLPSFPLLSPRYRPLRSFAVTPRFRAHLTTGPLCSWFFSKSNSGNCVARFHFMLFLLNYELLRDLSDHPSTVTHPPVPTSFTLPCFLIHSPHHLRRGITCSFLTVPLTEG